MAGAAGHADQERRFDRTVGEAAHLAVRILRIPGELAAKSLPACLAAVQPGPALRIETRIGEFAQAEGAGGSPEREIAGRLALVFGLVMHVARIDRRIRKIACGIAITFATDILQQRLVARAPVEAVGFVERPGRTSFVTGFAAAGIVDDAPCVQPIVALFRIEHAIPVDEHADALLEGISVEAAVAGGRLVPDLAARAFGRIESRFAHIETRIVTLAGFRSGGGVGSGSGIGFVGLRDDDRPGRLAAFRGCGHRNPTADRQYGSGDGEAFHFSSSWCCCQPEWRETWLPSTRKTSGYIQRRPDLSFERYL